MKKTTKKKKKSKKISLIQKIKLKFTRFDHILLGVFFTGVLLLSATYAWFYASLNVRIESLSMTVSDESGLFISLDGVNFGSTIDVSKDILFNKIDKTYPTNTSQWPDTGLYPVSTNGVKNSNQSNFEIYSSTISYRDESRSKNRVISTKLTDESKPNSSSNFIAFDIFLKNITGSPYEDNIYLDSGTSVALISENSEDQMGIINSVRIGFLKMNTISKRSSVNEIQAIKCNNNCRSSIYEPNSYTHTKGSINRAMNFNLWIKDGTHVPTYSVINEGRYLELANGHEGSGVPLDEEHFALQNTITDPKNPVFGVATGITKVRVYVWVEGQDIDSLETRSKGSKISITINFYKDLAGYNH